MSSPHESALSHYRKNKEHYLDELKTLVRIPSISFDGYPKEAVVASAEAVAGLCRKIGLDNVEVVTLKPGTHPYVVAEWNKAPAGAPTLLLYAHHDVQPIGNLDLWKTPPFEPTLVDNRLFGRGTADDKAGVLVHLATIDSYLRTHGALPVNVKLVIEGEEEIGSEMLPEFLAKYRSKLDADVLVLTDTQNFDTGHPSLTVSLRGLCTVEVEVRGLRQSVHSGMWGGPTPDVAQALSKMLASVTDSYGRIAIPELWQMVAPLTSREREAIESLPYSMSDYRKQAGLVPSAQAVPCHHDHNVVQPLMQMWREPSFSINAFEASSRKASANIINATAWARLGLRLAPGMDPEKSMAVLKAHLKKHLPWGLEIEFKNESIGGAWSTNTDHKAFDVALEALEKGYAKKA